MSTQVSAYRQEILPVHPSFLDGVIDRMVQLRAERGSGMFAFAAPHWRAGTSHVVGLVAEELSRRYRRSVGILPTALLAEGERHSFVERAPGMYVAVSAAELGKMTEAQRDRVWVSRGENDFDFTLADCPALLTGARTLKWTHAANGVFLVVSAGVTHMNQIEESKRLLRQSSSRLEGMVLNRRSYPIPNLVYKLL